MAKQYWGVNRGQHQTDVTTGSSDLGTNVEVVVDLSVVDVSEGMTREEVIRLVQDAIIPQIIKENWPPA